MELYAPRADHYLIYGHDASRGGIQLDLISAVHEGINGARDIFLPTAVWAAAPPLAEHGIDTTDTFEAGVASLQAHAAYIDGLGWDDFDPREMLEGFGRQTGQRMGTAIATSFEVFPMGWGG